MPLSSRLLPAGHLGLDHVAVADLACVLASEPGQLLAVQQLTVPAKHKHNHHLLTIQVEN